MSEYNDLLKKRRSVRNFLDRNVPLEVIREIIQESCLAPSSMNGQPWRFIVITDKALIRKLSEESKKNTLEQILNEPASHRRGLIPSLRDEAFNVYYNAPCLVYITGAGSSFRLIEDCSLSACYFMFSAAARGLGTCWIGGQFDEETVKVALGIPGDVRVVALTPLGYPAETPDPRAKKPLDEIVSYDKW